MPRPKLSGLTVVIAAATLALALAAPASARWYGSAMQGDANATYGCESALILGALGGVELAPTNQRSCTYRHGGYLDNLRPTSIAPASGRVTRIQVKSGPKPNTTTTLAVNVPVQNVVSKEIQNRIHSSDGLALSAVGPGTLPLHLTPAVGNIATGAPLLTGFFPMTSVGEPRVDGYTMAGIDLLFRWDFRRR